MTIHVVERDRLRAGEGPLPSLDLRLLLLLCIEITAVGVGVGHGRTPVEGHALALVEAPVRCEIGWRGCERVSVAR